MNRYNQNQSQRRNTRQTGYANDYTNIKNSFVPAAVIEEPIQSAPEIMNQNIIQIPVTELPVPNFVTTMPTALSGLIDPKEEKVEMETVAADDEESENLIKLRKINFKRKLSAKEKRFRQNRKLKKLLTPRNATVALHELFGQDGSSQISEFQVKPSGNQFQAEVVINNNRYEGYGTSKMSAKNNACEKALRDLIINKLQQKSLDKTPEAQENGADSAAALNPLDGAKDDDVEMDGDDKPDGTDVPMLQIAAFALHKLFSEWENEGFEIPLFKGNSNPAATSAASNSADPSNPVSDNMNKVQKPGKIRTELPPNAETMHPVVLLSIMRPCTTYSDLGSRGVPPNITHTVGCTVDGASFMGVGRSKKDARKVAAAEVLKALFQLAPTA